MAEFAMWLDLTEKGIRRMEDAPAFLEELEKAVAAFGGQGRAYVVTGEHDLLIIGSVPKGERVMHLAVAISLTGEATATTMSVYSKESLKETPIEKGGSLRFMPPLE